MQKKIGLDLDGVLVGLPPFIPSAFIEWLYKDHSQKQLSYRYPPFFEQKIRQLSHLPFIRPEIKGNCRLLKELNQQKKYCFYLITGRFAFLEKLTFAWLKKYNLIHVFDKIYLNKKNIQPHKFKEQILNKVQLDLYIEDDFDSIIYLATRFQKIHFYWYTRKKDIKLNKNNITAINNLSKIL